MDLAVGKAAQRSGAGFPTAAGGRSYVSGSSKTVTEQDRRRSVETNPNSRQSRRRPHADSSSHLQDRDISMDGSITSFVGIDVSKHSLDLCVLPQETRQEFSYDTKGLKQLFRLLPDPGTCLIVVEATGGYQRRVVAELAAAGHLVAVVNPRPVRHFAIALGILALTGLIGSSTFASMLLIEEFKIDLGVVAALLTVIGYSLNDTIVILDRIRENRGKLPLPSASIINTSINQTISRTVLTSLTTLLAVAIMYYEGGSGMRSFTFCLLVGLLVGTYSSVAIAAPLVLGRVQPDPSTETEVN